MTALLLGLVILIAGPLVIGSLFSWQLLFSSVFAYFLLPGLVALVLPRKIPVSVVQIALMPVG
jgi:hypothetical protein